MVWYFYYILLGIYSVILLITLVYYFSRRAPTGDASVGWALGVFYLAGLAAVITVAWLLRHYPYPGLFVLGLPLLFLALPKIRYARTELYARFPAFPDTPALTLLIENNSNSMRHVQLECWFPGAKSHSAVLYDTLDFYLDPQEKAQYPLTAHQTRLLAHKSKYVTIMIYERIKEEHEGHTFVREIQPCLRFYDVAPEVFRSGEYTLAVD